ncbi:PQQ-binding-like beta-propeller repeat protein [Actinoplanes sp. NPDC051851]|uniref:PQQ-binding-like beta-propeller repeat protein n=1 Tax=Actinoplanes sp. NPDC051851 TaxID=3154753 RepID=UPI00341FFC90
MQIIGFSLALLLAWGNPGYDAENSYYNPHESVIGTLKQRWRAPLRDIEASCSGFSAPLVAGDRVFATDRRGVSAYDATSGDVLWRFDWDPADDNDTPTMAVADDLLILVNGDCNSASDPDGRLTALDVATGDLRWALGQDVPAYSAVVDKGAVVVSGYSDSDGDGILAYSVTDGHLLWHRTGVVSTEVSADGVLLTTATDGYGTPTGSTAAVRITTGRTVWTSRNTWLAQAASPSSDTFYVSGRVVSAGPLLAVDARTGKVRWSASSQASPLIAADGERVYRAEGARVQALDAHTGRLIWSHTLAAPSLQPTVAGGLLYTGSTVLRSATGVAAAPSRPGFVVITSGHLFQVNGPNLTAFSRTP